MDKPIYSIPTMKEISELPYNGFNAISLFSGCGGSSLGYKMAGYKVLWANEFIPEAQNTYRENHPNTILDCRDIRTIQPEDILEQIGLKKGELDILDGSPPCSAFSTAGAKEKGWGKEKTYSDSKQRVDDLFFEYIRILRGIQPKVFVAENVSGLVKGTAKGYFKQILQSMKDCGYKVSARLLNAKWLGVPQSRERLIFVGVRNDIGINPIHPKPLPYYYTILDAFNSIKNNFIEDGAWIDKYAIGDEWDKINIGGHSEKYYLLYKSDPHKPSNTITATSAGNTCSAGPTHPYEKRKFSLAELKAICSFPSDFILTGTYQQQGERLGRAVPPVMMKHIANTILEEVLCKTK